MTMVTFILVLCGGGTHAILSTYAASNTRIAGLEETGYLRTHNLHKAFPVINTRE